MILDIILKWSRDFLLCTKKETNCPLINGSVLITFTVRVTKQHPVNISVLDN